MATRIGTIEPFDPDSNNWEAYVERIDQFFIANGIENDKKVSTFLTIIGEKAYELLRNCVSPDKPSTKTYKDLVGALQTHLKPKPIIIAEEFKFHRRNQKEGESIAQYVTALCKLAETCDFQAVYRNEVLRDRLVCGIRSEATQKRLFSEENLTLAQAQEIAQALEAVSRHASELQGVNKSYDVHQIAATNENYTRSCYHRGKSGHLSEKCYFRMQNCRNCGKQGHIAKVCRQEKDYQKRSAVATKFKRPSKSQTNQFVAAMDHNPDEQVPLQTQDEWGLFAVETLKEGNEIGIKVD